uniref:Cytochrome 572 n=1 Tax=Leptospirillum ferriphilum TaxID=178606 RepID=K4ENW4_9BACT|nr:cytochrome 572 [Leptospirillum ferriphilum]
MRKTLLMFLSFFALASVAIFFSPKTASAFPGFARKYNFPCSFCHIQWPRLADTGHFFKDRGFMLSTTGKANGLDMMFQDPKNQNYFPIGFHMSMAYYGSAVNGAGNANQTSGGALAVGGNPALANNGGWANGPGTNTAWDLESGGLLNPWISFWVQPGAGGTPIGFGLVKLWVRFDDLLNSTWLNLYVGKTSVDMVSSNQRAMAIGTGAPFTMYDYQPGLPEVENNGGTSTYSFLYSGGLYTDGDIFKFLNDATSIRYFGYHMEGSGEACATQKAFSLDPCETRINVNFLPNTTLYSGSGFSGIGNGGNQALGFDATNAGGGFPNNGFSFMTHVTQSFGGWGRTNGERIGAFALVGNASALPATGAAGGTNATSTYTRFGVDVMLNPLPNGNLNIVGAWEIVSDPTGMIEANTALMPNAGATTSGLQYMTWFTQVNWQPTFGGFFSQSGTNSNLIEFIYNQLNMTQQPTFSGTGDLPGNFDNVLAFTLLDRYWLWGSDRADISLFAQYQYMVNYGVSGVLNGLASASGQFHAGNYGAGYFGDVEANNFSVGLDFTY